MDDQKHEKIRLNEINSYLTCYLCKGYLIDATTISECLHSFCRSCIIKFLQENSYCPVCEVIINKAKPNLKLDKTLQDIVYKLVPGLFLKEMLRRKQFYFKHPSIAARMSPEQRGEDTERTIFNPQDRISLSLEFMSEDSSPGVIAINGLKNNLNKQSGPDCEQDKRKSLLLRYLHSEDNQQESLLKRYLQCPGMCRIDVIKKFIQNKYNVNCDLFQIDILYKRVPLPLPDHYTLIDIAYIYMWKRNEPMKFYFRIIDKVSEHAESTPIKMTVVKPMEHLLKIPKTVTKKTSRISEILNDYTQRRKNYQKKTNGRPSPKVAKTERKDEKHIEMNVVSPTPKEVTNGIKTVKGSEKIEPKKIERIACPNGVNANSTEQIKHKCDNADSKKEDTIKRENLATIAKVDHVVGKVANNNFPKIESIRTEAVKDKVYTNITLNRTNNVEIITQIQKTSSKDGQPSVTNIINQTVKKSNDNKVQNPLSKQTAARSNKPPGKLQNMFLRDIKSIVKKTMITDIPKEVAATPSKSLEDEKFEFLKSIELTAKNVVLDLAKQQQQQQHQQKMCQNSSLPTQSLFPNLLPKPAALPVKLEQSSNALKAKKSSPSPRTAQKRKNSSPVKNEPTKKPKLEKKATTKIILQPKILSNPSVRQIVSNVNQNATNMTRLVEQSSGSPNNDLQSLFPNYNINIPKSLSITLKESAGDGRKPIPPVDNRIEILKIPHEDDDKKPVGFNFNGAPESSTNVANNGQPVPSTGASISEHKITPERVSESPSAIPEVPSKGSCLLKDKTAAMNPQLQSFQKIFEESIKKVENETATPENSSENQPQGGKRNILEIASQLFKQKNRLHEQIQSPNDISDTRASTPLPKVPIPRLNNQRVVKPPQKTQKGGDVTDSTNSQMFANMHSTNLGMNYTVSVGPNVASDTYNKMNGSFEYKPSSPGMNGVNVKTCGAGQPSPSGGTVFCKSNSQSPRNVDFNPNFVLTMDCLKPSKSSHLFKPNSSPSPKNDLKRPSLSPKIHSPRNYSPKTTSSSPKSTVSSSKTTSTPPKTSTNSPKTSTSCPKTSTSCPSLPAKPNGGTSQTVLTPSQLHEKYNIPNLAQLSASLNFNSPNFGMVSGTQLAALQQAMLMKQFELHNRQKWLNMNQTPLLQYLQSLNAANNPLLGNIKDN